MSDQTRLDQSRLAWVPAGAPIEIHGRSITCGMIYAGARIAGIQPTVPVEPALIDPKLKITSNSFVRPRYDQWGSPAYNKLSPTERAAYLDWLEAGRPDGATIQFLLLFYYGLERRLLFDARHDATARQETPMLLAELDRLRHGFHGHSLLELRTAMDDLPIATRAVQPGFDPTELDPPSITGYSPKLPLALRLALGWFAAREEPLPPKWALSWAICSPGLNRSTVERRCPEEFARFFEREYHRLFGEGIRIRPDPQAGNLLFPALSPSFQRTMHVGDRIVPNIGAIGPGQRRLIDLIDRISAELQPFAQANPSRGNQPALTAYAFLPESMGPLADQPRMRPLLDTITAALGHEAAVSIEKSRLLAEFGEFDVGIAPREAEALSLLFERIGYGIEPDPATMRSAFQRAESVGLYRREYGPNPYYANRDRSWQLALLDLWSYIAAAGGPIATETAHAVTDIVAALEDVEPFELHRLRAHALWLSHHPATLSEARRRYLAARTAPADETALVLTTLASIDSALPPRRIRALHKVYALLGLSEERLHGNLHRIATRQRPPTQIIERAYAAGFGIPAPPDPHAVRLDAARVAAVREETDSIASVLSDIFTAGESFEIRELVPENRPERDDPHTHLIALLRERPRWRMSELSALASSLGMMASGAIETINDRAAARDLEPALECDDEYCDCYEPTLKELLAHD